MNLPPPARTRNVSPPEGAPGPQVITAGAGWPRCRQMAPTVDACNLGGLFCWRAQEWGSDALQLADDPEFIIDGAIEAQRKLLSGFGGAPRVPRGQCAEAPVPRRGRPAARRSPAVGGGGSPPDTAVRDRGGAERGRVPPPHGAEVRPRVAEAPWDARAPPD